MTSEGAARRLETTLNRLPDVRATTSHAAGVARIAYDPEHITLEDLDRRLRRLGLRPDFAGARVCDGRPLPKAAQRKASLIVRAARWLAEHPETLRKR